ncbi:MAG: hypothetical protein NVSMB4_05340 [Acidimicrobiales bacterium]
MPELIRIGAARLRLSIITLDQVVSGGSNVLASVIAARLLAPDDFGLFGIVFMLYTLCLGFGRALVGTSMLMEPKEAAARVRHALGSGLLIGLVLGLILAVVGGALWLTVGEAGGTLVALGACLPMLMVQDLGRYLGFATLRPRRALELDVIWLGLLLLAFVAARVAGVRPGLLGLTWIWAGSGAVAGVVGMVVMVGWVLPSTAWLRSYWHVAWKFLLSAVGGQVSVTTASALVRLLASPTALGAVVGAQLLTRPFTTVQVAAVSSGLTEMSNAQGDGASMRRRARGVDTFTVSVALVNSLLILFLPDSAGRLVLGATWLYAKPLLLATSVLMICSALATGPRAVLLARRQATTVVVLDMAFLPLLLVAAVTGVALWGALGYVWCVAGAWAAATIAWRIAMGRELARADR